MGRSLSGYGTVNVMPRPGWKSVSLPKDMVDKIQRIIESNPELGYKSVADFIVDAIRRHPDYYNIRFEHFNVYEDHVTIFDKELKRLVDVYFSDRKPYVMCSLCEDSDCIHIRFTLSLEKVRKILKEKGFVIKDDKIIRGPF